MRGPEMELLPPEPPQPPIPVEDPGPDEPPEKEPPSRTPPVDEPPQPDKPSEPPAGDPPSHDPPEKLFICGVRLLHGHSNGSAICEPLSFIPAA